MPGGGGFDVARTKYGVLNISGYNVIRYLNQLPNSKTYKDHLGRERAIDGRNDIQYHRALLYMRGWLFSPKFTYSNSIWGLQSTQQMSMVGSLSYEFSKSFELGGGIFGLPGSFTLLGNFPFWLGTDRVMANEFLRPGFTAGFWATGNAAPRLEYTAMVGNTIAQVGVSSSQLTRNKAWAGHMEWFPTTGEYGPRRGLGDFEEHPTPATRLGLSYTQSREDRQSQPNDDSGPDNVQTRLSDGVLFFSTGALAPGVTIQRATYHMVAMNTGVKYRGFSLDSEMYYRWLTNFNADGPLPQDSVNDRGLQAQISKMVKPKKLMAYTFGSYVFGEFNDSWSAGLGLNYYPFGQRNMRVNLHWMYVDKCPTSSQFGYYVAGETGHILSVATDFLF